MNYNANCYEISDDYNVLANIGDEIMTVVYKKDGKWFREFERSLIEKQIISFFDFISLFHKTRKK